MASKRAWAQDSKIIRKRLGHLETVILLQRVSTCSGLHVDIIKSSKSVRIHHDTPTINVGFTYRTINIVWYRASFPFEISSGFIQVGLVDSWIWLQICSGKNCQNTIISGSIQERPKVSTVSTMYMVLCANSFWMDIRYESNILWRHYQFPTGSYLWQGNHCISGFLHVCKTSHSTCPPFWPFKHDAIRLQNTHLILAARSVDFHDFLEDYSTSVFTPSVFWLNHSRVAKSTKWPCINSVNLTKVCPVRTLQHHFFRVATVGLCLSKWSWYIRSRKVAADSFPWRMEFVKKMLLQAAMEDKVEGWDTDSLRDCARSNCVDDSEKLCWLVRVYYIKYVICKCCKGVFIFV